MSDLDEHFARLRWVKGEIERLDGQVKAYTDTEPLEVYWHYKFKAVEPVRIYKMRIRQNIPDDIPIHAGVILNEMRAILDSLACVLAVRNGFEDVSGVYFPTGKTEGIFKSQEVQRKIKKLSPDHRAIIAGLQPYGGGNDMLYALHSSDLIRKHQRLIVLSGEVASTTLGPEGEWILDGSQFSYINAGPGHPMDEPVAVTNADYHIEIHLQAVVAFSEPAPIKSKPLIATLNDFASLVESILKLFLR